MYKIVVYDEVAANKCEFCNKTEGANRITSRLGEVPEPEPEIEVLACGPCLQEIQLGHVLKDIYGWSWTKFEGKFIAEYQILEPKYGQEATNVPF